MDRATEDKKSIEWRTRSVDTTRKRWAKRTCDGLDTACQARPVGSERPRSLYVNGDRVFDFNQVKIGDIDSLHMNFWTARRNVAIRRVRFAESAPDFGQTITSSGKFVTHGILFDTDSDRVKPESAAVIQSIAKGLMQATGSEFRDRWPHRFDRRCRA